MGLVMEHDRVAGSYEPVPLALRHGTTLGERAVLRRRSARHSRRAVVYVLCLADDFVSDDVAAWYTDRGFHFYAADLREVGQRRPARDYRAAAEDLGECFGCLDDATAYLREAGAIDTVVISAHGSGALVAALWCHARRGSRPADALILARPRLGPASPWLSRERAPARGDMAGRPEPPLLAAARRRVRRGLDIPCPVLVMCPPSGWDVPGGAGGLLASRLLPARRVTVRLGEHVTWLRLPGAPQPGGPAPGQPQPVPQQPVPQHRPYFDELGRWLGAYLSGEIRDRLL